MRAGGVRRGGVYSSLNFWSEVFLLLAISGASAPLLQISRLDQLCCAMQAPKVEFLDYGLGSAATPPSEFSSIICIKTSSSPKFLLAFK
jgi:hypothetical protein